MNASCFRGKKLDGNSPETVSNIPGHGVYYKDAKGHVEEIERSGDVYVVTGFVENIVIYDFTGTIQLKDTKITPQQYIKATSTDGYEISGISLLLHSTNVHCGTRLLLNRGKNLVYIDVEGVNREIPPKRRHNSYTYEVHEGVECIRLSNWSGIIQLKSFQGDFSKHVFGRIFLHRDKRSRKQ